MGFFKKWREKRKQQKTEKKDIKHPESSYDIYNQSETLTLQTNLNKDLLVAYEKDGNEDITISNSGETDVEKNTIKNKKNTNTRTATVKTRTTTIKKGETMAKDQKKGRNIYYVSARKDKEGKKTGWEVKKENADKITKLCKTKEEAIEFVKEKAGNQGSTCIIRKMDGSIEKTMKFGDE